MKAGRTLPFRVQVLAGADLEYFRDAVLGARHYGFSTGRLVFADRWLDHELTGDLRALARRDGVQGIVGAIHSQEMARRVAASGVPVVNISNSQKAIRLPLVTQDDVAVGRLAAAHLLGCGCRAFGFWGQAGASYSEQRREGFRAALTEQGLAAGLRIEESAFTDGGTAGMYARMRTWLAAQSRPLGVFAVLDTYALLLMRAARELGWRVPEDVAVLGAGDDDFWVEFESVPLSSVRLPAKQIGYEAAALLDRMIANGVCTAPGLRLPVSEIAARKSTDALFVEDAAVAKAVRFIREHGAENPYVDDVVRVAGVSRSALQARFRKALGLSILQEIQQVRVARAQALLANSELPMSVVAERCGFPNSQRFSVLFREQTGLTPGAYRRQFRGR